MGDTHFSGNVVAAGFERSDGESVGASYAVIPIRIGNVGTGATVARSIGIGTGVAIDEVVGIGYSCSANTTDGDDLTIRIGTSSITAASVVYLNDTVLPAASASGNLTVNGTAPATDSHTLYARCISGSTGQASDLILYVTAKMKAV